MTAEREPDTSYEEKKEEVRDVPDDGVDWESETRDSDTETDRATK